MALALQGRMLSTATTQGKRGYSARQQPSRRGSPRPSARQQQPASAAQAHLKALAAEPDANEPVEVGAIGDDVAGLPIGQIPDGDSALEAAAPANDTASETAASGPETSLSDYST